MRPICSENTEPRDIPCEIGGSLALTFLDLPLSFANLLFPCIPSPISSYVIFCAAARDSPSSSLPLHASFCNYLLPPSLSGGVMWLSSIQWVSQEAPLGSFFNCNVQNKTKALETSAQCIAQKRTKHDIYLEVL